MTTFHFQTHVPSSGVITFPTLPADFYGEDVVVNVNVKPKSKRSFEDLCDAWCEDERSTEEIIRDIYDSRTIGRERDPL